MGLLRKAASTATSGETVIEPPPPPAPEPCPAPAGLLKKIITLKSVEQTPLLVESAVEATAPLSVELAGAAPLEEAAFPGAAPLDEAALPATEAILEAPFEEALLVEEPLVEEPLVEEPLVEVEVEIEELPAEEPVAAVPAAEAPSAPPAPVLTTEDVAAEIVSAVKSLTGGVELPARLFTALSTRLSIQKGALLLYDPMRLVYAPWASKGYDQTTLHRLRIPLGANESWNALANGSPLVLADAQSFAPYQQFFSSREYGTISRILLTPFIAEEKLIAVLLITDASPPFEGDDTLVSCLSRVAEAGAPLVHAARSAQLSERTDRVPLHDAAPGDESTRFIASFDPSVKSAVFLSLSTEEYAKQIIASHEHLDPFRLHEDMRYFLTSFLADVGRVMSVRTGLFIVGLFSPDTDDIPLFLHQLSLFFHGLFGGNGREGAPTGPRMVKKASWPADGGDMRTLIGSLSG